MTDKIVDIILHVDEETTQGERNGLCDTLTSMPGVETASCRDKHHHLMIIEYDPDAVNPKEFITAAKYSGFHSELIGML